MAAPYLTAVEVPEDLQAIDLLPILEKTFLDAEKQERLEVLAPATIVLPDGYPLELQYMPNGQQPRLEVRLQDVEGWQANPTVDDGEMTVLLHLLDKDLKLVAVAADLGEFRKLV